MLFFQCSWFSTACFSFSREEICTNKNGNPHENDVGVDTMSDVSNEIAFAIDSVDGELFFSGNFAVDNYAF